MEVQGRRPEEALGRPLRVLLGMDQAKRHGDVLEAAIVDPWGPTEDLHIELALKGDRAIHNARVIRVEPHPVNLAIQLMWPADKEGVPLELVEVDEESVGADVGRGEAAGDASGEVRQGLLDATTAADGLPAPPVLNGSLRRRASERMDFRVGLLDDRRPEHVGEKFGATTDRHIRVVRLVLARGPHRHVVVHLDAHPRPVFVEPCYVHRPANVPAVEELPCEFRPQCHSLQSLHKVAIVKGPLVDPATMRLGAAEVIEEVAGIRVV
mmetsp:Transcript_52792/g.113022  ORF Transcript_52792/g.113022 Transcript_52792/m.113022 type:complete len:267 (+) Transcript_52792:917-1717(+)